jgi:hypothetical protein
MPRSCRIIQLMLAGGPVGFTSDYTSAGTGPDPAVFDINNQGDWVLAPGQNNYSFRADTLFMTPVIAIR